MIGQGSKLYAGNVGRRPTDLDALSAPAPKMNNNSKKAFTQPEIEFLKDSPGYKNLSEPKMRQIFSQLARASIACDWPIVEKILARMINTRITPSGLLHLADTDLGALVSHVHLQPPCPATSFSIRLATLCVAYWSDSLKLVANLIGESLCHQKHNNCQCGGRRRPMRL